MSNCKKHICARVRCLIKLVSDADYSGAVPIFFESDVRLERRYPISFVQGRLDKSHRTFEVFRA